MLDNTDLYFVIFIVAYIFLIILSFFILPYIEKIKVKNKKLMDELEHCQYKLNELENKLIIKDNEIKKLKKKISLKKKKNKVKGENKNGQ